MDTEALVIGAGAAGLSAALVLGRARVQTLVVDAGEQSNLPAHAIGGLLAQDGTSPAELYATGRAQVTQHPAVELRRGTVVGLAADGDRFVATLHDGGTVTAARLLLAGGMRYAVPEVPGLADQWGGRAFACPYCHGWEHRDGRIVLLGAMGLGHRVRLLQGWSADLVVASDGPLPGADRAAVEAAGVPIDERSVASVGPEGVVFTDGDELRCDAVHVVAPLQPRDGLVAGLGLATEDNAMATGMVVADRWGATSDERVFAAGDVVGAGNVAAAIATGNLAATGLHRSLVFPPVPAAAG